VRGSPLEVEPEGRPRRRGRHSRRWRRRSGTGRFNGEAVVPP